GRARRARQEPVRALEAGGERGGSSATRLARGASAPARRRHAELALEGAAEGAFGLVAAPLGDTDDGLAPFAQQARGEREAPARQVLHRRLAEKRREALRERRAR